MAELYRRHQPTFETQAVSWSRHNHEIADEALGEHRLKLSQLKVMLSFDSSKRWQPWASSILRRECVNAFQAWQSRTNKQGSIVVDPPGKDPPLFGKDEQEQLALCMSRLSEEERAVLALALEGDRNPEIARKLGITVKDVGRIKHRAKEKLQQYLGE